MDAAAQARYEEWAAARAPSLHRTAYLLCGDWHVAEDMVQEALVRAASRWRRLEGMEQPEAYVRKVLVNGVRRRGRLRSSSERPASALPSPAVLDGAQERADRDALMGALARLPARQRATVVLRYFEQLSEVETAHALECSTGTVKSQTSRALAALRRDLTAQEATCSPRH